MPTLTVEGFAPVDVESGKRLVLAIEQDAHVDILHACGGNARCTTCRIEFVSGEPQRMTRAEKTRLEKEAAKADADIKRVDAKLSNEKFVANAPEEIVEEEKEKREAAVARKAKIVEALKRLESVL